MCDICKGPCKYTKVIVRKGKLGGVTLVKK